MAAASQAAVRLGSGLIDPEEEDGSEGYGGEEGVGASVVPGVDSSPVFEAGEHVLDFVALAIEDRVVGVDRLVVAVVRDAGDDAAFGEGLPEPAAVISAIAEQAMGLG